MNDRDMADVLDAVADAIRDAIRYGESSPTLVNVVDELRDSATRLRANVPTPKTNPMCSCAYHVLGSDDCAL